MPTKVPWHPLNFGTAAAKVIKVVSRYPYGKKSSVVGSEVKAETILRNRHSQLFGPKRRPVCSQNIFSEAVPRQ
ncbi:hypothetical protein TNCV_2776461 [Trichonephila clavipes]|nr:hypothetical protein TNCV_2776461 [Trichonephila clavipes]